MSRELYEKIFYLNIECEGIWDDFDGPGAELRRICWSDRRGPFTSQDLAEQTWKEFYKEIEGIGEHKAGLKYCGDIKITECGWDGLEHSYRPEFNFRYEIKEDFQMVGTKIW